MTVVQDRTKRIIEEHVAPFLKQHAFKKAGKTFFKFSEPHWLIINFQSSMWNFATSGQFTINVARHDIRYDPVQTDKPPKFHACKPYNAVRVGQLMDGKDKWWTVDEQTDTTVVGQELVQILKEKVLPCFEQWGKLENVGWNPSIPKTEFIAS